MSEKDIKSKLAYVNEYMVENSCDDLAAEYFADILSYIVELENRFSRQRNLYKELQTDIYDLQQENQQLKEQNECLLNQKKDFEYIQAKTLDDMDKKNKQLKQSEKVIDEIYDYIQDIISNPVKYATKNNVEAIFNIVKKYRGV